MAFLIVGVLVVALIALGVVWFFAAAGTYDDNGVSFEYPKTWVEADETTFGSSVGDQMWSAGFAPPTTGDTDQATANLVAVSAYRLTTSVTADNVAQVEPEVRQVIDGLTSEAGSTWPGTLTRRTVGGKPAFVADDVGATGPQGQPVQSRIALIFDGTTQYFINCQYEPAQQAGILAGCARILDSFEVTA
jgi:hypothetical protein